MGRNRGAEPDRKRLICQLCREIAAELMDDGIFK